MTTQSWAVLAGAFLLGSIPTAYVVGRIVAGVDIRSLGDGNMGALNTYRNVGLLPAALVAVVDIGKGAMSVIVAQSLGEPVQVVRAAGLCAVLGHDFTPFLRLQGGQGMAAILGIFGVLYPQEIVAGLLVAALALVITRNWDLSWAMAFGLFVVVLWLAGRAVGEVLYPAVLLVTIGLKKLLVTWQERRAVNGFAGR
jgi:glycerol-3-phosphate acyltransferase PlsY